MFEICIGIYFKPEYIIGNNRQTNKAKWVYYFLFRYLINIRTLNHLNVAPHAITMVSRSTIEFARVYYLYKVNIDTADFTTYVLVNINCHGTLGPESYLKMNRSWSDETRGNYRTRTDSLYPEFIKAE